MQSAVSITCFLGERLTRFNVQLPRGHFDISAWPARMSPTDPTRTLRNSTWRFLVTVRFAEADMFSVEINVRFVPITDIRQGGVWLYTGSLTTFWGYKRSRRAVSLKNRAPD